LGSDCLVSLHVARSRSLASASQVSSCLAPASQRFCAGVYGGIGYVGGWVPLGSPFAYLSYQHLLAPVRPPEPRALVLDSYELAFDVLRDVC